MTTEHMKKHLNTEQPQTITASGTILIIVGQFSHFCLSGDVYCPVNASYKTCWQKNKLKNLKAIIVFKSIKK